MAAKKGTPKLSANQWKDAKKMSPITTKNATPKPVKGADRPFVGKKKGK